MAGARPPEERLIWALALGAFGLAWPTATVAAYLPPVLSKLSSSDALIGAILAAEGVFALTLPLVVGPLSDATATPWGRRRPYLLVAVPPMAIALALLGSLPSVLLTTAALFIVFFGNYMYEPPWRSLYADLVPNEVAGRAQGASHVMRGLAMAGALVGGGLALAAWQPLPFVIGAVVTTVACLLVPFLVHERPARRQRLVPLRERLSAPIAILEPVFDTTHGYAAMWPTVALPVLLVIPLVRRLARAEAESDRRA